MTEPAPAAERATSAPGAGAPEVGNRGADSGPAGERQTTSVELLWDLVFVFAVTQVTTLLAHHATWTRLGEAMLILAIIWWAWSAFVWASNAQEADSLTLRGYLLASAILIFISGLAVPHAFGSEGLLFAGSYTVVRLLHLGLYADASRRGRARRSAIRGFGVTVLVGMALLICGALVNGGARAVLWTVAIAIDYAGPALLTRRRLRGLQHVAVSHFADRYGDFVIICLGESIVAVGVGVSQSDRTLSAGLVLAAALGLLIAIGMWWTYFDRIAEQAQARLRSHEDPVIAAADAFSYLHLLMVAGIIIYASGVKLVVHGSIGSPMPAAGRLAFCGGIALYLLGLAAFRLRLLGQHSPGRLAGAAALVVLDVVGGGLASWVLTLICAIVIAGLCGGELAIGRGGRAQPTQRSPAEARGAAA